MHWSDGFIAVDWGTTNRRAYLIGSDGRCLAEMEDDRGILSVDTGGFPDAVGAITDRLGDHPMLMAGMIGSNRGWKEAPYVPAPAGLEELAAAILWVEPDQIGIVPGISWTQGEAADVMRGEEVQILGALADGLVPAETIICHPGTHNKWIRLENGRIATFRTVMTGEIFNLLKEHSILADLLKPPAVADAAFEAGVRRGFEQGDLTADLFSVRARVLLGKAPAHAAASYTSGLLIGSDLRIGLGFAGDADIVVMGRPELTGLFAAALRELGREGREIDGEEAFLAGARRLAELLS
ncbi:2-dehydro-3-deoxygalactonokinase [Sphingosinicella rhizophila]|uniref:2-dehydro-3-deoxygalactonokinase n=1 Tax=Sphingosinicella rhizophila TaxID=3050082 RepID=A0ABU3Q4Q2_9SPHN|nr:2-dehydro-3-deoxygalactonokinase [Sphingosinicella sp. GR2756]MDT9598398.1 2-dehydro-3-deoxygalactonokinase [Sphingosinicella sp. GR2756]